jgi:hypothetical protein
MGPLGGHCGLSVPRFLDRTRFIEGFDLEAMELAFCSEVGRNSAHGSPDRHGGGVTVQARGGEDVRKAMFGANRQRLNRVGDLRVETDLCRRSDAKHG